MRVKRAAHRRTVKDLATSRSGNFRGGTDLSGGRRSHAELRERFIELFRQFHHVFHGTGRLARAL